MMCKWVWLFIERINKLADEVVRLFLRYTLAKRILTTSSHCRCSLVKPQIDFKSRLVGNKLNDCLMTINGTDFCIQQKGITKKGNAFGSHKYSGKSALQYKLDIDILKGNLVWVEGLYPAGAWPDIKIFLNTLVGHLLPGKCVEANNGYVGHPNKIKFGSHVVHCTIGC